MGPSGYGAMTGGFGGGTTTRWSLEGGAWQQGRLRPARAQVIFLVKKTVGGTTWGRPCVGCSWRLGACWRSAAGNLLAGWLVVWLFVSSCLLQLQSTVSLVYLLLWGAVRGHFCDFSACHLGCIPSLVWTICLDYASKETCLILQ